MNPHHKPDRNARHSLQWRKGFSTRQKSLYNGQDKRLYVAPGDSVIEEFFRSLRPGLSPPRRHESLRLFLEQTGAQSSFPDAIRGNMLMLDKKIVAMVDDRCDPSLEFINMAGNASFVPVRQWGSDEYMRNPPEGLNVQIRGLDASTLYSHLNQNVSTSDFCCRLTTDLFREKDAQKDESCKSPASTCRP